MKNSLNFQGWNHQLVHSLGNYYQAWANVMNFITPVVCNTYIHCDKIIFIDGHDAICLELLSRLLYPRGLVKNAVFIKTFKASAHYYN